MTGEFKALRADLKEIAQPEPEEPIDQWIEEYLSQLYACVYPDNYIQIQWRGFLIAKRTK